MKLQKNEDLVCSAKTLRKRRLRRTGRRGYSSIPENHSSHHRQVENSNRPHADRGTDEIRRTDAITSGRNAAPAYGTAEGVSLQRNSGTPGLCRDSPRVEYELSQAGVDLMPIFQNTYIKKYLYSKRCGIGRSNTIRC